MGSLPTKCGEEFESTSTAKTEKEAKKKNQEKANKLCKRLGKGCDQAHEVGEGSTKNQPGEVTYTSTYVCIGI